MKQRPAGRASSSEKIIRDIKRKTRKQYSAEEKIRIVLDGLRDEDSIAELCRREGIAQSLYYKWSKDFMEAGKKRPLSPEDKFTLVCNQEFPIYRQIKHSHRMFFHHF